MTVKTGERSADLNLPGGCILCGGDLDVRLTPSGAQSCCLSCRWIARPHIELGAEGLKVAYIPAGNA